MACHLCVYKLPDSKTHRVDIDLTSIRRKILDRCLIDVDLAAFSNWAIPWAKTDWLSIGPIGPNVPVIWIETSNFSFKKTHLKMSTEKHHFVHTVCVYICFVFMNNMTCLRNILVCYDQMSTRHLVVSRKHITYVPESRAIPLNVHNINLLNDSYILGTKFMLLPFE